MMNEEHMGLVRADAISALPYACTDARAEQDEHIAPECRQRAKYSSATAVHTGRTEAEPQHCPPRSGGWRVVERTLFKNRMSVVFARSAFWHTSRHSVIESSYSGVLAQSEGGDKSKVLPDG